MSEPEQTQPSVEEWSFQEKRNARLGIPEGYSLHEPFRNFWPNVASNIAKAEVMLALLMLGYGWLTHVTLGPFQVHTIFVLVETFLILLLVHFLGIKIVSLAAIFIILALNPLFRLLKTDCENVFSGVFVGGTVGMAYHFPFVSSAICPPLFY